MAKIHINNPKQVINGGAKKYYFKVKGLGGPKGDKGDKGDTGATGPQGPQGNAATVSIGSTTTLPVGYDATVTNSGSIYNAVLNFGIPQGPRGPQGATGATGAKGDKGDQGNPGPQGEKGTNATVYIGTTSTLNPGSQATVYNSGTDSNAVLNFGIPKGEKGDTGPMPTIAQTTGQAIDQVMSQKATTDALNTKQATITSSNKLSADLVDDTSTTNKFVTAQDITNWNGKQDALTAGTGIDITGGVISTPAIVPEVVAELPTTGAEGKLYLTPKAHTIQPATGNPITTTVTEEAGQIESFQLDGDTYQQSYTGKNLLNYNTIGQTTLNGVSLSLSDDGTITLDGTCSADNTKFVFGNLSIALDGTYTLSFEVISGTIANATDSTEIRLYKSGYSGGLRVDLANTSASNTLSVSGDYVLNDIRIDNGVVLTNYKIKIQLEKSATATSFEPYVGGQPSPSPDYPQQIQTVTGTQTISINGTNYPISLGTIELCKLGTYQDYIYKDGENWKVHKATSKATFSSLNWQGYQIGSTGHYRVYSSEIAQIVLPPSTNNANFIGYCSIYTNRASSQTYVRDEGCSIQGDGYANTGTIFIYDADYDYSGSATNWKTARGAGQIYFVLKTAKDTVITDTTLIAQLEAIRTASLANGTNTITNTTTGTNLAGDMEIGYYGYNPINRYDKFIWLDLNNNYEQIGS